MVAPDRIICNKGTGSVYMESARQSQVVDNGIINQDGIAITDKCTAANTLGFVIEYAV